jgi:hypothetical protein
MSLAGVVFWASLAAAFLALVLVALLESWEIKRQEHPFGGLPQVMIPTPVVRALRRILLVEFSAGFVLAAAAAVLEALSSV